MFSSLLTSFKLAAVVLSWVVFFILGYFFIEYFLEMMFLLKSRRRLKQANTNKAKEKEIKEEKEEEEENIRNPFQLTEVEANEKYHLFHNEISDDLIENTRINLKDEELIQVFVINGELDMGAGKISAQIGHCSIGIFSHIFWEGSAEEKVIYQIWNEFSYKRILYLSPTLNKMTEINKKLKADGIYTLSIRDAGRTQIKAGSNTVIGTIPIKSSLIMTYFEGLRIYDEIKKENKEKKEKNEKKVNEKKGKKEKKNEEIPLENKIEDKEVKKENNS